MKRWGYIPLRSREKAENFLASAPICKRCVMQRTLKSAKKWMSYGLFTYFLRYIILQVYLGLIFRARAMKLILNYRKGLFQLLLKGHLDISIRSRVMKFFWRNFEKLPKRAVLHVFDSFSAMDETVFTLRTSYFCCLLFRLFAMYVTEGNDIHQQD
jgi:hypothetical protein